MCAQAETRPARAWTRRFKKQNPIMYECLKEMDVVEAQSLTQCVKLARRLADRNTPVIPIVKEIKKCADVLLMVKRKKSLRMYAL